MGPNSLWGPFLGKFSTHLLCVSREAWSSLEGPGKAEVEWTFEESWCQQQLDRLQISEEDPGHRPAPPGPRPAALSPGAGDGCHSLPLAVAFPALFQPRGALWLTELAYIPSTRSLPWH